MNIQFKRSGLRVGDAKAKIGEQSSDRSPCVGNSGSDAGEGGHAAPGVQGRNAALNSSGPRVGGEAVMQRSNPTHPVRPSETPQKPRSRADVARLLTRSASDGGAAGAMRPSLPGPQTPRQQNSAGNGGGEQATRGLSSEGDTPAAKSSGREIGAGKTRNCLNPKPGESPRDNSDRKVGDGEAMLSPLSKRRTPPIQISGASALGDEAITPLSSKVEAPRRNSPGRKAGADPARRVSPPNVLARDPHCSGREAGAGQAVKFPETKRPVPDLRPSGFGRGDESQGPLVAHGSASLIAELVQLGRARRDWMKTRVGIELRAIAICRRFCAGDKDQAKVLWKAVREGAAPEDLVFAVGPLLGPIASLVEQEKRVDRQMTKLAGQHEMAAWAKAIRGFGHAGLAKVIAECGDIGSYRGPACVWKRMGLAVINGGRQRRVPGAEALEHGYNAERRSVMWNVGGAVIGGMGKGPRPLVGEDIDARADLTEYQKLFVHRLRLEAERDPEAHAREPVTNKETGQIKESFSAHAANRAKRYVEKRLLRDLWVAWRRAGHPRADPHWENAGSPT